MMIHRIARLTFAVLSFLGATAMAAPPDLTNGGVPNESPAITINLGPTGMRGWVYHVKANTGESRQILVKAVAAGSPAAGILAVDDVILGADGTGAAPVNFPSDARKALANAINDAEALNPAILKLIRWRAGVTETVEITLQTLGAYTPTAPYNCPKSALILENGLQSIMAGETAGRYSFGTLGLLAGNNPANPNNAARRTRAQTEARALIPSAATMVQMKSDVRDTASGWQRGHTLIVLAEYYLQTGDAQVLPAIEAYAVNIAKNQSMFGTLGHIYAEKFPDGSNNGPMGGVYGPVNSAGLPCFYGLLLARQCGLTNPEIDPAIERTSRFFSYYAGRGSIPYGEHEAFWQGHENNGKSGLAAVAFSMQANRAEEQKIFAKMASAATSEREVGHTGAFFNMLWAPLGAAAGGEVAAASHFSRIRWMLDLNRRWNGGFDYDCLNEGPNSGSHYNDFRMSTAALLVYALPLRQLVCTGRNPDQARWLSGTDATEAGFSDTYSAPSRSTAQLVADLGNWSPKVQRLAADELAKRTTETTALLPSLHALANDPVGTSRVGACIAIGKINNSTSAPVLAALLTDPANHVRFAAAEGMRYMSQATKLAHLNTILAAAASTAAPLLPFDEEDPLHFSHARIAMLLFYSGTAYGPKGVIHTNGINTNPVNRALLYPAIRAVAANPIGQARSTLSETYKNLTLADVNALADTLVDSIHFRAPSDKMFSGGIRQGGIEVLEKYNISEGVPLSMEFMVEDGRGDSYTSALGELEDYAGSCTTVVPDPDVIGFCEALLAGGQAAAAQAVLNAIAADPNPAPLTPFKSIQSVTADAPSMNLPAKHTVLRVNSTDLAKGDSIYTWRKVYGAGNVSFFPNGTGASKDTTILFDGIPGHYLFEVKMSDSRDFTEVYQTVAVTLRNSDGSLPPDNPPAANPQTLAVNHGTPTPVTLTGSDPEGFPLVYTVTTQPTYGTLSGTVPYLLYTPDFSYTGSDSFTFKVTDSQGQVSTATIDITVGAAGSYGLAICEPFNYTAGALAGKSGASEIGLAGTWAASTSAQVVASSLPYGLLPTLGGSIGYLNGGSNNYGGTRAIGASALSANGLLNNGATLWFSVVMGYGTGGNLTNSRLAFALSNSNFSTGNNQYYIANEGSQPGSGLGVTLGRFDGVNGKVVATQFRDSSAGTSGTAGNIFGTVPSTVIGASAQRLVVGKITWGATPSDNDTIELFEPDTGLDLDSPTSTLAVNVNQSNYDAITWCRGDVVTLDEIRFGPTHLSVLLGNAAMTADLSPPVPDPVGFHSAPAPSGPSSITMVAATAHDLVGVEYYFTCTAGGGHDSGWQTSTTYTDTGLTPGVAYTYTVKARDLSPARNQTAGSPGASATIATTVTVPNVINMPQSTAEAFLAAAGLGTGTVTTAYSATAPAGSIAVQTPAGESSTPVGSDVDLIVSLGPDVVAPVITPADIVDNQGGGTVAVNTLVTYTLTFSKDINEASVHGSDFSNTGTAPVSINPIAESSPGVFNIGVTPTAAGTLQLRIPPGATIHDNFGNPLTALPVNDVEVLAIITPDVTPPTPNPIGFAIAPTAVSSTGITMTAATASDPSGVEYYFACTVGGGNDSGWQDSPSYNATGLTPETQYTYTVRARDKSTAQNAGGISAPASATTLPLPVNDGTWTTDGDGNWSNTANWQGGVMAGGRDKTAFLTRNITADRIVTLDSARTIGNITFTDATTSSHNLTIAGASILSLDATTGTPVIDVTQSGRRLDISSPLAGGDGLAKAGPGILRLLDNSSAWTGNSTVSGGLLDLGGISSANIGGGTGRNISVAAGASIRFNSLSNPLLNRIEETNAEIGIMTGTSGNLDFSGSTGANLPNAFLGNYTTNGAKFTFTFTHTITPASDNYRLGAIHSNGLLGMSGNNLLTGTQGLIVGQSGAGGIRVNLSGSQDFTGDTVINTGARLSLGNNLALRNSPLNVGAAGGSFSLAAGTNTGRITGETAASNPTFGGLKGSRNLLSVFSSSGGNNETNLAASAVTGFILNPGIGVSCSYSGAIADFATATTLTKTGQGTQTLSGANTYTGATNINQGTLALVGGSQASPITVATGASLGFTPGSPTTSTSSVDLTNGTVKITGTVDGSSDYLLMTASAITGTPVLDPAIPNYTLRKSNGDTQLELVHNPYGTWSGGAAANFDTNNDGVENGVAWALNAPNPNANAIGLLPTLDHSSDPAYVLFNFNRSDAANADANTAITVEYGNNLIGWTTAVDDNNNVEIEVTPGAPTDAVVVKLKRSTLGAGGRFYARLKVVVSP